MINGEPAPVMARGIAGVEQVLTDAGEPRYSFPAISAFITAYAREYMLGVIGTIGEHNVYYQAVDALIVNQEGYDQMIWQGLLDEYAIGKFKLVGTHDSCDIRGANYYKLDDVVTASGLTGVAETARKRGKPPEIFENVTSVIATKPDGIITVSPLDPPTFTPDYRGTITKDGRWMPYRVTMQPDWTDQPPRLGFQFGDSSDREGHRILLAADV